MKGQRIRRIEKVLMGGMILIMGIIAYPQVRNFFENARQNKCLSHLHQLGQALRIYWEDHREAYPPLVDEHGGQYYTGGAAALVPDYLKSARALYCPKDRRPPRLPGYSSYNLWDSDGDGRRETITYNAFGWLEDGGTVDRPGGWPSAALPTAEGQVRSDLQQAWQQIGYRRPQQPYLANGNAPPNTIVLTCLRHTRRSNDPLALILRVSDETEVVRLQEADFISQLTPRQRK
jgi:hypothetical protein